MKKIFCILCALALIICVSGIFVGAAEDFKWSQYDKGYVTIVFDDGGDCTATLNEMFKSYNMPLSCAIVGNTVEKEGSSLPLILKDIQNHGGEILSHTYTHSAFSANTTLSDIEYEFSNSYNALTKAGFVVNGIIEAGSGGGEKEVDYNLVEQVSRKYYKYSNAYGTSLQYKSERIWMSGMSLGKLKATVSKAAKNKDWVILFAHNFSEVSKNDLEALLQHIEATENVECVTYKYMYENFGNYAAPQDFGDTYYTVSYADSDGIVFESKVVAAGQTISASPENPPTNTQWTEQAIVVNKNITITPAASPEAPEPQASSDDVNSPIDLWIVIGIAAMCIVLIVVIMIFVIKKNK